MAWQAPETSVHCNGIWYAVIQPVLTGTRSPLTEVTGRTGVRFAVKE
ncbi:hypothetical protein [Rhizobium sp. GR12]